MRDSELAHVDNHPADLGTDLHDEELDETTAIFFDEEERRIAEARRALASRQLRHLRRVRPRRSQPERLAARCPRPCAASTASAASRGGTGSRPRN